MDGCDAKPDRAVSCSIEEQSKLSHFRWLVRLAIRAGDDHGVAVGVLDPDLAMSWTVALAFRRISVRGSHNRCLELVGAYDDFIEVGHFTEPEKNAIADFGVWVDEKPMVVFDIAMMKLKDESAAGKQPLVLRATMITAET